MPTEEAFRHTVIVPGDTQRWLVGLARSSGLTVPVIIKLILGGVRKHGIDVGQLTMGSPSDV